MHPYRDCAVRSAASGTRVMRVMVFFDGACIALEHLAAGEYMIGPEAGASMSVSGDLLPCPQFPLLRHDDRGWALRFTPSMTGSLGDAYAVQSLSELSRQADRREAGQVSVS